ncbi:hypothetical protein B0T13DRAFT_464044 [Neurospora crassa]|nr:hypothetical protein B0T13DRAFT_464044 [Neurospora crassa]
MMRILGKLYQLGQKLRVRALSFLLTLSISNHYAKSMSGICVLKRHIDETMYLHCLTACRFHLVPERWCFVCRWEAPQPVHGPSHHLGPFAKSELSPRP